MKKIATEILHHQLMRRDDEVERRTLGLHELALLHTSLDSAVELGIESSLGRGDLIVAAHVFLNCLTAVDQFRRTS